MDRCVGCNSCPGPLEGGGNAQCFLGNNPFTSFPCILCNCKHNCLEVPQVLFGWECCFINSCSEVMLKHSFYLLAFGRDSH